MTAFSMAQCSLLGFSIQTPRSPSESTKIEDTFSDLKIKILLLIIKIRGRSARQSRGDKTVVIRQEIHFGSDMKNMTFELILIECTGKNKNIIWFL